MITHIKRKAFFLFVITFVIILLLACEKKEPHYSIGVIQWTEQIQPYVQSYRGVLDSLNEKGYMEGVNLTIDYVNVEQDNARALLAANKFVKRDVNLIVTLGTGSTLAALQASKDNHTPIVFSIVGAPKATGIIKEYNRSGRNITGVSMKIPMEEQLRLIQEILPQTSRLGILFSTDTPQAVATSQEAINTSMSMGWQHVTTALDHSEIPQLRDKVRQLVEDVDVLYLPTDPVLGTPDKIQTIVRVADRHNVPVIGVARNFVEAGALAALHCDFYELGRQTGEPIGQILKGISVETIPSQKPMIKKMSLNLEKARYLKIQINRNAILKADFLYDNSPPPGSSSSSP